MQEHLDIDEEDAMLLLTEKRSYYEIIEKDYYDDIDTENCWWIQFKTAECAKALGYIGCEMKDEQGTVYLLDGKNINLVEVTTST